MIVKIISVLGIILVTGGTFWSVLSLLTTKTNYVGTADWNDNQDKAFSKQKCQVICGLILIVIGSLLQILGVIFST